MKGTPSGTHYRRHAVRAGVGSVAAALTLVVAGGEAAADKFEVTTTAAGGKGSFTDAVKQSREGSGGDQISFKRSLRGQIDLPEKVTLKGKVVITGDDYGDPESKRFGRVVLRGHRGGSEIRVTPEAEGVLRDLYLDGTVVKASRSGDLTVRDSFLRGQRTVDETGISVSQRLRLLRTTVEGFDRGISTGASARIDRSTIADNVGGGGVFVNGGTADVSNSTISGNVVSTQGPFSVSTGGGLNVGYGASARVTNSTIVRNQAISNTSQGGGLFGNVEVLNSTITANRAVTGAGVAGAPGEDADVGNSIVYGNTGFDGGAMDCATPFTSSGGNLIGSPGDCLLDPADVSGVDPLLSPLGDYGGPTQTMALGQGSPAVGLAVKSTATKFDQRGVLRDDDPDAGATERRG